MATIAHVTPELLRWARESFGYTLGETAATIDVKPERWRPPRRATHS